MDNNKEYVVVLLDLDNIEMSDDKLFNFDPEKPPKKKPNKLILVPTEVYNKAIDEKGFYEHTFISEWNRNIPPKVVVVPETTVTWDDFQKMNCTNKMRNLTKIFKKELVQQIADTEIIPCVKKAAQERLKKPYVTLI